MTAEIAVLNKLAVTLAADSAVTLTVGNSTKVYNSADKIFEITNHDAIGLMVYNNPEVQGIPIEAVAKMYRDRICKNSYSTVFDFADAFLKYLETLDAPQNTVDEMIYLSIFPRFMIMNTLRSEELSKIFNRYVSEPHPAQTIDEINEQVGRAEIVLYTLERDRLRGIETAEWANGLTEADVAAAHGTPIRDAIESAFKGVELSDEAMALLTEVGALSLLREYQRQLQTGLVFAGFGCDEIFPSLIAFELFGTVAGRLKFNKTNKFDVDRALVPVATVIPFAQQEMVDRFIYGMDSQFLQLCETFFDGSLTTLQSQLRNALQGIDIPQAEAVAGAMDEAVAAITREFRETLIPNHLATSREQLSDIIRSMPKQELAALCESLVHITSLKRKFSADAESVGGPIDVAMITRAEGFVWVKRKHFFEPHLNPRYFHRRYGSGNVVSAAATEGDRA